MTSWNSSDPLKKKNYWSLSHMRLQIVDLWSIRVITCNLTKPGIILLRIQEAHLVAELARMPPCWHLKSKSAQQLEKQIFFYKKQRENMEATVVQISVDDRSQRGAPPSAWSRACQNHALHDTFNTLTQCFPNCGLGSTSGSQVYFWWVTKSFWNIKKNLQAPLPSLQRRKSLAETLTWSLR